MPFFSKISIPYRSYSNAEGVETSSPHIQFQSLIGLILTLCLMFFHLCEDLFQSLIGLILTPDKQNLACPTSHISIPYRSYSNLIFDPDAEGAIRISIPYRSYSNDAHKYTFDIVLFISIPYRSYSNFNTYA